MARGHNWREEENALIIANAHLDRNEMSELIKSELGYTRTPISCEKQRRRLVGTRKEMAAKVEDEEANVSESRRVRIVMDWDKARGIYLNDIKNGKLRDLAEYREIANDRSLIDYDLVSKFLEGEITANMMLDEKNIRRREAGLKRWNIIQQFAEMLKNIDQRELLNDPEISVIESEDGNNKIIDYKFNLRVTNRSHK